MVKAVTLEQVARSARLSPAAVSRYLNGSLSLPLPTRARIERAVRELGYSPNPHARSLSRGRSDAMCSTSNKVEREVNYVEKLKASFVDGLLFATNHHDADGALATAINGAGRVVLVDEDVPAALRVAESRSGVGYRDLRRPGRAACRRETGLNAVRVIDRLAVSNRLSPSRWTRTSATNLPTRHRARSRKIARFAEVMGLAA